MRRAVLRIAAAAALLTSLASGIAVAGAAPSDPPAPVSVEHAVFLPLVVVPPVVEIRTGPSADERGAIDNPATTLPAGAMALYIDARIRGADDLSYHVEMTWPDGKTSTLERGVVFTHEKLVRGRACFGTFGSCTRPLPSGVYYVRVLLNGMETAAATVSVP